MVIVEVQIQQWLDSFTQLRDENTRLREALETDKVIFELICEDHTRPRYMRSNTSKKCMDSIARIEQALKKNEDDN